MARTYRRISARGRRTGGSRRGRRLQQNGQIVVRRGVGAGLAGAIAQYGPGAMRAAYRVAKRQMKYRSGRSQSRFQRKMGPRTGDVVMTSSVGRARRSGVETTRTRSKFGAKRRITMSKLISMRVPRRILYVSGVNRSEQTNPAGYFVMPNRLSGTVASGSIPLYAICLSGTFQGGSAPAPIRRAILHSTGRVQWEAQQYVTANGATLGTEWTPERADVGADTAESYKWVEPEWYQIKLNMYGATEQHTRYIVEYIQCNHDFAAIEDEADVLLSAGGVHGEHYRDIIYGYWQDLVKAQMSNPIAGGHNKGRPAFQPYRVLKRWVYDIQPNLTIEADASPNNTVANIFLRDHRLLDHGWVASSGAYDSTNTNVATGVDDNLILPNFYNTEVPDDVALNPSPRQRRYLVIRAVNTTRILQAQELDTNTPSFDMVVRRSERLGTSTN